MRRPLTAAAILAAVIVMPIVGPGVFPAAAQTTSPQSDEFNNNQFTFPFAVQCGAQASGTCPDPQGANTWSLNQERPGSLRIMTQFGSLVGSAAQSSNNARNLVLQPTSPTADYTITTDLTFPGAGSGNVTTLGQTAGLLVYQDDDHFIYLGREFANNEARIVFLQENGPDTQLTNRVPESGILRPEVFLRITKTGTLYQASYSYDNLTFTPISPGLAPTPVPSATATSTSTPTVTPITNTPTATGTPATAVPTATAVATATSVPLPTGYTAAYAAPRVGVFAWGGTNTAVNSAVLPADFNWFRVGANAQTPGPSPTATMTNTPGATSTATVTSTATAVPSTATATSTSVPTATSTSVPPTATATAIPTATPKPKPHAEFSYVSVWYSVIHIGDLQHLQIQAKSHSKQGIWAVTQFATGQQVAFYTETNSQGFWQAEFKIPSNTISKYSPQAVVTFQLWKGSTGDQAFKTFTVIP